MDDDAPIVAGEFYKTLFQSDDGAGDATENTSEPDITRAAYALRVAVQKLRLSSAPPSHWVPFIHLGL